MDGKFAFESGEVSIAFPLAHGLGDSVIAVKVFDALVELAPACRVDIFYKKDKHRAFAEAFFGGKRNLNRIASYDDYYKQMLSCYDLALWVGGCHIVALDAVNVERLQTLAPALLEAVARVEEYNRQNVFGHGKWETDVAVRNIAIARALQRNCFWFLSCGGALPIRDDKVNIPLKPACKSQFDKLKLGRYITIYSNIGRDEIRPKVKTWPMNYLIEYVALVKKNFPALEVVQVGGGNEREISNVDRQFLGCDLELTKYILANSLLHVGCEGGLVHLATALGTKCLAFFGSSDWYYFSYGRNLNFASSVCSPCAHILPTFYVCLRGEENPPCMMNITPQEAFDAANDWLKNNA